MPTDREIQSERDRELALVGRAKGTGSDAQVAQQALLKAADRRIFFMARELKPFLLGHGQADGKDLIQAGREGFLKALRRFNPSKGFRLWTFAKHEVRGAMLALTDLRDSADSMDQPNRESLEYSTPDPDGGESAPAHAYTGADHGVSDWLGKCSPPFHHAFDTLAQRGVEWRMAQLMVPLTKQERTVVQAISWGIPQDKIAEREKISQTLVSRIYARAIKAMREANGGALPQLEDFVIERQSSARIPVGRGRTMRTPRH
jgi:RNA polymerase sigma factor (sigma-70 family)